MVVTLGPGGDMFRGDVSR